MPGEHRNTHARSRNREVGNLQNLSRFVAEFLFFVGFTEAIVNEVPCLRNDVERNVCRKLFVRWQRHRCAAVDETEQVL